MDTDNIIIGGMQAHQSIKTDGICTCLTSSMGMGGGYIPMIVVEKMNTDTRIPRLIGGIGEINFGKQYRQGNRIYDSNHVAMAILSQPVGNLGGCSYLYLVEIKDGYTQNN